MGQRGRGPVPGQGRGAFFCGGKITKSGVGHMIRIEEVTMKIILFLL